MDQNLDKMLRRASQLGRTDARRAVKLFEDVVSEAFGGEYPNSDRGIVLFHLVLAQWEAGYQEKAFSGLAGLMVFCARTGELSILGMLQEYVPLENCCRILINYCPPDASPDEIFGLLTDLEGMLASRCE